MKHILTLAAAFLCAHAALAQNPCLAPTGIYERNGELVASDPVTTLAVDLTVEKETVTVGPYARYAQKYLGTRGALTDRTVYRIREARIALAGGAESAVPAADPRAEVRGVSYANGPEGFARVAVDRMGIQDLSVEEAARNAANTIYSIRRHRLELITSEAGENVFGAGLAAALAELDRQEQAYTELFLGKQTLTTRTHRIRVRPVADKTQYMLCRFSETAGVVAENDLTGEIVLLQLEKKGDCPVGIAPASPKESRTATFRVAADVECTLYFGAAELARTTLPIFAFGRNVEFPLPARK